MKHSNLTDLSFKYTNKQTKANKNMQLVFTVIVIEKSLFYSFDCCKQIPGMKNTVILTFFQD